MLLLGHQIADISRANDHVGYSQLISRKINKIFFKENFRNDSFIIFGKKW